MPAFPGPSPFPPPTRTDADGFLAITFDLNAEMLMDAYSHGIFPWPEDDAIIPWCSPPRRGVIPLAEFHLPTSFRRFLRHTSFHLRIDTAFATVIDGCAAQPRPGQDGTWITAKIRRAYCELHDLGWAHSFECWDGGQLVGGMYGVSVGGVFSGESMFHLATGASKFALAGAAAVLQAAGARLLDAEMVTSTTALFGAREIPRRSFLALLHRHGGAPLTTDALRHALATLPGDSPWNATSACSSPPPN